jgi:hypothetical protein
LALLALIGYSAAGSAGGGDAGNGDWLVGNWSNRYNKLEIRRDGDALKWVLHRERHASEKWGEKPAARFAGDVGEVTERFARLKGIYEYSERARQIGSPIEYSLTLDAGNRLSGELFGYARSREPVMFTRSAKDRAAGQ